MRVLNIFERDIERRRNQHIKDAPRREEERRLKEQFKRDNATLVCSFDCLKKLVTSTDWEHKQTGELITRKERGEPRTAEGTIEIISTKDDISITCQASFDIEEYGRKTDISEYFECFSITLSHSIFITDIENYCEDELLEAMPSRFKAIKYNEINIYKEDS